ncbi:MAG: hypothetical protein ACRDSL_19105 [Pseudonocardiaceae bacterium]
MTDSRELDEQVLGWLSPDGRDPASISQHDAQQLAWWTAPRTWFMRQDELTEVASACAGLLETSGRHRAAAALREHTPAVLAAWARSAQHGRAACHRAMQATGVQPPDTPTLVWGSIMGSAEASVLDAAQRMLESAIDTDAFVPGEQSWRSSQCSLVETWLRAPSPLFAGQPPVEVVHAERTAHWVEDGTSARHIIMRAVLPRLSTPIKPATDTMEPLRFLLDTINQGIALTTTGRLPLAFVRDVAARFGWGMPAFKIRHEGDVVELGELRDLATRTGLITLRRRPQTLTLTAAGQAALDDPAQLWATAAAGWFDLDDFAAHVAEIAAAILLAGPATAAPALAGAAHEAVAASFCDQDGAHPDYREVRTALWEWLRPGHMLRWLSYPPGTTEPLQQLTDPGRAAAIEGLRHRSRAPLHDPC